MLILEDMMVAFGLSPLLIRTMLQLLMNKEDLPCTLGCIIPFIFFMCTRFLYICALKSVHTKESLYAIMAVG